MWNKELLKTKSKALAVHFGISTLFFLPFLYLIWVHWFPPPFFYTDGGWQGIRIMLFVDLVIGPALTFLIFNPAKSRRAIRFDFACIGLVQAAALVYGYISVESQRIQAVAFYEGEFNAVTKQPFARQSIEPSAWDRLGARPPYWVFVREPQSPDEEAGVLTWELTEGIPRHELEFLYEPLTKHWEEVRAASLNWRDEKTLKSKPEFARLCAEAVRQLGEQEAHCLPLYGYFRPASLIFDQHGRLLIWKVGDYD